MPESRGVKSSVCACLDLSVSSFSWGLGRAADCDCGTPWTFLLPFLYFQLLLYLQISNWLNVIFTHLCQVDYHLNSLDRSIPS